MEEFYVLSYTGQLSVDLISRSIGERGEEMSLKKVKFSYFAPLALTVCVAGSFNEWKPEEWALKKDEEGYWNAGYQLEPGRYEYRFVVDGNWENDQNNNEIVPNHVGTFNNVLVVR